MGRPVKDANHPLVRLRKALSASDQNQFSREALSKKTGIPEPSLKDIETGRYKMTPEVAYKISFTMGVDPKSLLNSEDPLRDLTGQPYSKSSPKVDDGISVGALEITTQLLLVSAWETAKEKKMATLFTYMFDAWLRETFLNLGLESAYNRAAKRTSEKFDQFATAESKRISATKFKQLAEKKSHSPKKAA